MAQNIVLFTNNVMKRLTKEAALIRAQVTGVYTVSTVSSAALLSNSSSCSDFNISPAVDCMGAKDF